MSIASSLCRSSRWSISVYHLAPQSRSFANAAMHDLGGSSFDPSEAAILGALDTKEEQGCGCGGRLRASWPLPVAYSPRRCLQLSPSSSSDNLLSTSSLRSSSDNLLTSLRSSSDNPLAPTYHPSNFQTASPKARAAVANLLQRCSSPAMGVDFTPAEDGCGGVYFVTGHDGHKLSVFKPTDEEVSQENNPKGYTAEGDRDDMGATRHFGAPREVAAYYLDQMYGGFSGVPVTALVTVSNSQGQHKWGSLQEFVSHEDSAENFGGSIIPLDEVHKIGVLDIRLVNNDRHFANILCRSGADGKLQLTPIDHGAVLPSCFNLDKARFEWLYWKQAKQPFSEATLKHIKSLNPDKDADFLRSMDVDEECVVTMVLATRLLQLGADYGLSLWDIGNAIQRDLFEDEQTSLLEQAIADILGKEPTKEAILDASGDIAIKVVNHALAGVDYLTRKREAA